MAAAALSLTLGCDARPGKSPMVLAMAGSERHAADAFRAHLCLSMT
eukprot:SM011049S18859  [mRNA]  locus=s11049:158:342:+ [translate_table: standard]